MKKEYRILIGFIIDGCSIAYTLLDTVQWFAALCYLLAEKYSFLVNSAELLVCVELSFTKKKIEIFRFVLIFLFSLWPHLQNALNGKSSTNAFSLIKSIITKIEIKLNKMVNKILYNKIGLLFLSRKILDDGNSVVCNVHFGRSFDEMPVNRTIEQRLRTVNPFYSFFSTLQRTAYDDRFN